MLETAYTAVIYRADNGWAVELRQGRADGKLIGVTVTSEGMNPGQLIDAAIVGHNIDKANKVTRAEEPTPKRVKIAPQKIAPWAVIPTPTQTLEAFLVDNDNPHP